jgi:enamine deaminase RidA (YjgF/YER057c/UK114 family)
MTTTVEYINPPGSAPAQGLYTNVARVQGGGTLLFIAGQLSVNSAGGIVGVNDFEAQFHQVFGNLGQVLSGMGATFNNVVKFTTLFVHSQDIAKFMKLRQATFPSFFETDLYPPNTILVIDRLVKEEFLLEVEAVANIP